jgi:hypothetical protein
MSSWRISDFSHNDASVSKFKQAAFHDICELFDHGKRRHLRRPRSPLEPERHHLPIYPATGEAPVDHLEQLVGERFAGENNDYDSHPCKLRRAEARYRSG